MRNLKRKVLLSELLFLHKNRLMSGRRVTMTEKQIPWSKLHEIADALGGKLVHITCVDHTGRDYKRIVIEYEEKK